MSWLAGALVALLSIALLGFVFVRIGGIYWLVDHLVLEQSRERFQSFYDAFPLQPGDIVFLGDSITAGAQWSEMFPGLPVKNRGVGGDTTKTLLARLHQVTEAKPSRVFLMIGTNDIGRNRPTAEILERYRRIVDRIAEESPDTELLLQSVLPRQPRYADAVRELNQGIGRIARDRSLRCIDVHPIFVDAHGAIPKESANDQLHLMGDAYLRWREVLAPYVDESR